MKCSAYFILFFTYIILYQIKPVTTLSTAAAQTSATEAPTETQTFGVFDNCTASGAYMTASISPNFDYIYSPNYESGAYPSNIYCRWYVTAPDNYAVEAYFDNETYAIESNSYCRYDYVIFYDGNLTTNTMLNKFCGSIRPTSVYRSSSTQMLIVFSSDYIIQKAGFRIRIKAVDNTYPGCKADYDTHAVLYNRLENYIFNNYTYINNISSTGFGTSDYPLNIEVFWLFFNANTTGYRIVLDIISISIERSYNCIYDRLVLYNGPCIKDGVHDTVCGYWKKQYNLDGEEYLLHFHSDGYITQSGFLINYYAEEKAVPIAPTTSTTTFGPPVGAVVDAVKEMLTNYSNENLPTRDLSEAIRAYVDFYFVGINGMDEVEQKLTSTGQFEVTWEDPSLSWDPTKRQGIVQVLLPQNDLWKPDIALMNGFSKITAMGAKFMFVDINYNGSCIWKPYQVMESVCKVDLTHYPYDRQICILKFGTWSSDDSEVVTELGTLGLQIHPNFQENSEWKLIATETKQEINNNHKVVEFFLTIERNSRYVTFYMTIPIIMLAYMNVVTFIIPTESGEKSGFSVTIFLSFVVLLIINNQSLPDNSDTISLYAAFLLTMTIMSAIALLISVLQIRALTLESRRYPIPQCFEKMIYYTLKFRTYLPFAKTGENSKRKRIKKADIDVNRNTTKGDNEASTSDSSGYHSSPSPKKRTVAFKIDNEENLEPEENDRFVLPRKRDNSRFSFERETTLFEANTIIRPSTALSKDLQELPGTYNKQNTFHDKDPKEGHITLVRNETEEPEDVPKHPFDRKTENKFEKEEKENNGFIYSENQTVDNVNPEYDLYELEHFKEDFEKGTCSTSGNYSKTSVPDTTQDKDTIKNAKPITLDNKLTNKSENNTLIDSRLNENTYKDTEQVSRPNVNVTNVLNIINNNKSDDSSQGNLQKLDKPTEERVVNRHLSRGESSRDLRINTDESVGYQSGSIFDEIMDLQASSASEYKMNRPVSSTEYRPLSVNRLFSSEDHGLALASTGRAISVGTSRPGSRKDGRVLSVLTQRPMSIGCRKRPASVLSQNYNTASLFGDDETEQEKQPHEEDNESQLSGKQSSESLQSSIGTDSSDEDGHDWSDIVSCTDVIFFIIYLFVTTLMSLAIFLTMITSA
ncbi:uncharacterized protein LOC132737494 [Ruditapes philippinarum]|uniref:uncharacterized protein LOC132737494 n=1 Tax=Ruditapes philippinarum TaxID=129788 RepID=UPI00295B573F|nr:uncharacterized protein LOC132737494 [Ruditapes philippinarum]